MELELDNASSSEFSTRSFRNLIDEQTGKRISEGVAKALAFHLETQLLEVAEKAVIEAESAGRKTVRRNDIIDVANHSSKSYAFNMPKAPYERILRKAGAERVSEGAVEALNLLGVSMGMNLAKEIDEKASHAERKTVKVADLELALRNRD